MANLKDVARLAKVGVGTVSRALNGTGYVSEDTKKKIDAAIKELDYTPNELARNLFRKRSGIIGVVIPDIEHPFFAKFVKQVEIELYKLGYKTMVCNTIEISNREQDYIEMLERNIVDGIITGAHSLHDDAYLRIQKPIVSLDRDFGPTIPLIHSDHEKGGRIAAEQLVNAGCKNVVQFGGSFKVKTPSNIRHRAFEEYMNEHRVRVTTIEMEWNMLNYEYYHQAMQEYMDIYSKADGVFTADMGAMYCLSFAIRNGIRVPEDLKIVGYDAMNITQMVSPPLTAVKQDVPQLAKRCVSTMMALLEGRKDLEYHQILDVTLQEGGTV